MPPKDASMPRFSTLSGFATTLFTWAFRYERPGVTLKPPSQVADVTVVVETPDSEAPGRAATGRAEPIREADQGVPSHAEPVPWLHRFEGYAPDSPFWAEPREDSGGDAWGGILKAELPARAQTGRTARVAGAIALFVVGLVMVLLAVTHTPLLASSATASAASGTTRAKSVVGTWNAQVVFGQSTSMQTLDIVFENLVTGVFSGSVNSPVGVETITGRVAGAAMSFTISLGNGSDIGIATVSIGLHGQGRIKGNFSDSAGAHGTITATCVPW